MRSRTLFEPGSRWRVERAYRQGLDPHVEPYQTEEQYYEVVDGANGRTVLRNQRGNEKTLGLTVFHQVSPGVFESNIRRKVQQRQVMVTERWHLLGEDDPWQPLVMGTAWEIIRTETPVTETGLGEQRSETLRLTITGGGWGHIKGVNHESGREVGRDTTTLTWQPDGYYACSQQVKSGKTYRWVWTKWVPIKE
jgi:hypothetical protein